MRPRPENQAFDLEAHGAWLRRLARALAIDGPAADDLVQETWLSALEHPPESGRSPRPWLSRVLRNLAHNARRAESRRARREREAARAEATEASDTTAA